MKPEVAGEATTKTVNLTFHITQGPKVRIRDIDFQGNKAIPDKKLNSKMKENKGRSQWLGWITGDGTYKEGKFEDDADKVQAYYRERGYVKAQIGQPELKILEDSKDGKARYANMILDDGGDATLLLHLGARAEKDASLISKPTSEEEISL